MIDDNIAERINEIADRFYERPRRTVLGTSPLPFDISKPNLHDTKQEFLAERELVDKSAKNAEELFRILTYRYDDDHALKDVSQELCQYVDDVVKASTSKDEIKAPSDLVKRNAIDIGITYSLAYMVLDVAYGFKRRRQELSDQEREFWSGNSRPPNHYARTIALRFARYIARGTGQKPTVGTSRDGGHPSTDFGRALEEVFELLGISADFRRAAMWAVDQLTDEDLEPIQNAPRLGNLGIGNNPTGLMGLMEAFQTEAEKGDED